MLARLAALNRWIATVSLWIAAAGLVAMTAVIGWQVYGRYVLNDTPHWSERLSLLLMLYYILFAAAVGVRERFHLGVVFIREALPPAGRRALEAVAHICIGGFGVFMVWYGTAIAQSTWTHTIPSLGIPTGLGYLPFPIAGGLIALFSLEHLLNTLAGRMPDGGDRGDAAGGTGADAPAEAG